MYVHFAIKESVVFTGSCIFWVQPTVEKKGEEFYKVANNNLGCLHYYGNIIMGTLCCCCANVINITTEKIHSHLAQYFGGTQTPGDKTWH